MAWTALDAWNEAFLRGALGEAALRWGYGALLSAVTLCSGIILWREWRSNPVEESEYGEWTNKQLFYAVAFALSFFVSVPALLSLYFS